MKKLAAVAALAIAGLALGQFKPPPDSNLSVNPAQVTTSTMLADAGYIDALRYRAATGITGSADAGFFDTLNSRAATSISLLADAGYADTLTSRLSTSINTLTDAGYIDTLTNRVTTSINVLVDAGYVDTLTNRATTSISTLADAGFFDTSTSRVSTSINTLADAGFFDTNTVRVTNTILLDAGSGLINGPLQVSGNLTENGRVVPVSAPNDGGVPNVYLEYGRDVMSSGTKTVAFKNAFTIAPACFCQDGTAVAACDVPISTITTSQAVVNGTTSDKFSWMCIGDR